MPRGCRCGNGQTLRVEHTPAAVTPSAVTGSVVTVPHITELAVRWSELDPYGHVNHAAYVGYLEVARAEALAAVGMGLDQVAKAGLQLVVVTLTVQYRRSAVMGDVVAIETSLSRTARASSTWRQRIRRGDTVLVDAEVQAAVTDLGGRPVRPPAWLTEALAGLGG